MNRIIKRTLITVVSLAGLYLLFTFGVAYYAVYQERKTAEAGRKNIEGARINTKRNAEIHEFASIIHKGSQYEAEGKYNLAIEQYKNALSVSKNNVDKWMAHCGLADAYEKYGQYELAIQEINWIIAQNPRQQVKDEYMARKQRLEKIMEESKNKQVNKQSTN